MDLFGTASAVVVPRWVKAAVVILLLSLIVAYGFSIVLGILDEGRSGWLEASAYLLGVLIPILIIVLVVGFSEGGVAALRVRTQEFLVKVLPASFAALEEPASKFVRPGSAVLRSRHGRKLHALVQHSPGTCIANYKVIFTPDGTDTQKRIVFRLELNARKVNFNLILDAPLEQSISMQAFVHSIEGATHEGYWFNSALINRTIDGRSVRCLVGAKKLEDDFLVNPVAKLDLAQDLMLMLRSFVNEAPGAFETVNSGKR
jgi:hypothetical protein